MQPYFFPYLGYFQLMAAVDEFVIYDNIQYTKRGWVNRNRIQVHGREVKITIPLKKASDYNDIVDRELALDWPNQRKKLINKLKEAYRKAPFYKEAVYFIYKSLNYETSNLYHFLLNQLILIRDWLSLDTRFIISSEIEIDHNLKSQDRVISICKARGADIYVNPPGGVELYNKRSFASKGVDLKFLKPNMRIYNQGIDVFLSGLSIIDIMMFCSPDEIRDMIHDYELI